MSLNRIEIYRHGEATYRQEIVSLTEAHDLTEKGRKTVRLNARKTASENSGISTKVPIYSSPLGRTLETAKIIRDELLQNGVKTENEGDQPLFIRRCLQEQINFSYSVMNLLSSGGIWGGKSGSFKVDPKKTNPSMLSSADYILNDALNMSSSAWNELPSDLQRKILSMESGDRIQRRIVRFINSLGKTRTSTELSVVVTHDALIALLLSAAKSEVTKINPGEKVLIEIENNQLNFVSIAGIRPREIPTLKLIQD